MTVGKRTEHAPPFSPSSNPTPTAMPTGNAWIMDESTRNKFLKNHQTPVASAISTICATLAVTPLENVKTRMQTHDFKNIFQCAKYLWRHEGPRGYVAGALPPLASVTAVRTLSFTVYNNAEQGVAAIVKRITGTDPLERGDKPGGVPSAAGILTFFLAGGVSGLVTAPIACPFELAKNVVQTSVLVANRAQAASGAVREPSLRRKPRIGTFEAIRQIVKRRGLRGVYTGFHLHALRDTVGTAMYFGIYETVKKVAAKEMGSDQSAFGAPAIAGAICSTIPWFCTYPLDTRKTRAQSVLLGKGKEVGEASMAVAKSSMYKGISIILIRTAVNNMILLSLLEYIKARINALPN